MGSPRPFRATVYLPGHTEEGHGVAVGKIARATLEALNAALEPWEADGYAIVRYEVLALPLEVETPCNP
jgi:hypothetical protein